MPCRERPLRGSSCFRALSSGVGPITQEEENAKAGATTGAVKVEVLVTMGAVWERPQESTEPRLGLPPGSVSRDTWIRFPTRWLPKVPDSGRESDPVGVEVVEGAGKGLRPTRQPRLWDRPVEEEGGSSTLDVAVEMVSGLPELTRSW